MTNIEEMIKKLGIRVAFKGSTKGLKLTEKATKEEINFLKANKSEIINFLETSKREERLAKATRYLVIETSETGIQTSYIASLKASDGMAFTPKTGLDRVETEITESAQKIMNASAPLGYGINGAAWEITAETETEITIDSVEVKETRIHKETAKIEAKESSERAETTAKFTEAKETGKPVLLREYPSECDGSVKECSLDIVSIYAMPDGTTETHRVHTY